MYERQLQVTATFSTPRKLIREMDRVAEAVGISRSAFIRKAIDAALEEYARSGFGGGLTGQDDRGTHVGGEVERRPTEEEWKVLLDWVDEQVGFQQGENVGPDADRMQAGIDFPGDEGHHQGGQRHDG